MSKNDVVQAFDDGQVCQEVGSWTEEKHRLVSLYAKLFSSGMKDKWHTRVYVELYAGAGYSRIRDTAKIIPGSPIRALTLEHPFDKYVFCEKNPEFIEVLKIRAQRHAPAADVDYVPGDCNELIGDVLRAIPRGSTQEKVLTLCFVDPPDIGIKFQTLRKLSARYVDFLVLLALYMDANRAYQRYLSEDAVKVDQFLDSATWRDIWQESQQKAFSQVTPISFPRFLAQEFRNSMATLGYIPPPFYAMKEVKLAEKNLPLYRLALFSRNPLAYSFWGQVLKYSTSQKEFDFQEPLGG